MEFKVGRTILNLSGGCAWSTSCNRPGARALMNGSFSYVPWELCLCKCLRSCSSAVHLCVLYRMASCKFSCARLVGPVWMNPCQREAACGHRSGAWHFGAIFILCSQNSSPSHRSHTAPPAALLPVRARVGAAEGHLGRGQGPLSISCRWNPALPRTSLAPQDSLSRPVTPFLSA